MQRRAIPIVRGLGAALLALSMLTRCGEDAESASCDELVRRASDTREAAVANASLACSRDEDCVLDNYRLDCLDDCGTRMLLARSEVPSVETATATANGTYCQQFQQQGCVVIPNPCVPVGDIFTPVCRSGQCDVDVQPAR